MREFSGVNWRELLWDFDVKRLYDTTLDRVLSICIQHAKEKHSRNKEKYLANAGTCRNVLMSQILEVKEHLSFSHDE